ncbi:MAG: ATP-dependent acyl-CoA ligase [Alphaproteobacteria bacterium]|nr:ATP-dependent acyl-CoA ligase [Alphaproteobacteria bacterium]
MSVDAPALLRPVEVLSRYGAHAATLDAALDARVAAGAGRAFLVEGGRETSYGGFAMRVAAAAALLRDAGVGKGDRVAVVSATDAAMVTALFATCRLGAVFVPVNPDLRPQEAAQVVARSRPRLVLHGAAQAPLARESTAGMATTLLDMEAAFAGLDATPGLPAGHPRPGPEDTCLVLFTSGTTGVPKGVMHAHRSFVVAGEGFVERQWLQPGDRMLCILPMFHVNALFYSLGGALAAGATLVLGGRFSASRFWPLVAASGATQVNMLGSIGKILALRPRAEFVARHALDRVYCVPMPFDVQRVFREEFGVRWIAEGYGMSEVPGILAQPYGTEPMAGTMGRVCRHPDGRAFGELRVIDEDGRAVAPGEAGTLLVRTELAMQGYFEAPEQTRDVFRDAFFVTGDRVREVSPGTYAFVARDKDMIRRRGENVAAAEIDQAALSCPDVGEAAAVAVPSELGEDDILLAVVPRAGATLSAEAVHAQLRARLAPAKLPRYVAVVDEVPYGPTQRVLRFKLAQDAALRAKARDFGG